MKDAENKFIDFLKEKGVFEEFNSRLCSKSSFEDFTATTLPQGYITLAFVWCPDGDYSSGDYKRWQEIALSWYEYIKLDGVK